MWWNRSADSDVTRMYGPEVGLRLNKTITAREVLQENNEQNEGEVY